MAVSAANGPLQHDTPPHSRASLPRDERTEPREDVNVAELPLASNAVDDTVDGMGVITFADEFTSRFFGQSKYTRLLRVAHHSRCYLEFCLL